jgi:DNA-binding IclR family transcriptional regulator
MMRVEGGASVRDLAQATGWQPNAIHSALATLRKQGCEIGVERTAAGNRYQIKAR